MSYNCTLLNIPVMTLVLTTSLAPCSIPLTDNCTQNVVESNVLIENSYTSYLDDDYSVDISSFNELNMSKTDIINESVELFGQMSSLTKEESRIYEKNLKNISTKTGRNLFNLL